MLGGGGGSVKASLRHHIHCTRERIQTSQSPFVACLLYEQAQPLSDEMQPNCQQGKPCTAGGGDPAAARRKEQSKQQGRRPGGLPVVRTTEAPRRHSPKAISMPMPPGDTPVTMATVAAMDAAAAIATCKVVRAVTLSVKSAANTPPPLPLSRAPTMLHPSEHMQRQGFLHCTSKCSSSWGEQALQQGPIADQGWYVGLVLLLTQPRG